MEKSRLRRLAFFSIIIAAAIGAWFTMNGCQPELSDAIWITVGDSAYALVFQQEKDNVRIQVVFPDGTRKDVYDGPREDAQPMSPSLDSPFLIFYAADRDNPTTNIRIVDLQGNSRGEAFDPPKEVAFLALSVGETILAFRSFDSESRQLNDLVQFDFSGTLLHEYSVKNILPPLLHSIDGHRLMVMDGDEKKTLLFDLRTGQLIKAFAFPQGRLSPDGRIVAGMEPEKKTWQFETVDKKLGSFELTEVTTEQSWVTFSWNSAYSVISDKSKLTLIAMEPFKELTTVSADDNRIVDPGNVAISAQGILVACQLDPKEKNPDRILIAWSIEGAELWRKKFPAPTELKDHAFTTTLTRDSKTLLIYHHGSVTALNPLDGTPMDPPKNPMAAPIKKQPDPAEAPGTPHANP